MNKKPNRLLYYSLFLIVILLVCYFCTPRKDGLPAGDGAPKEEAPTPTPVEEQIRDSIAKKEKVGNGCAAICQRMEDAEYKLSSVKSPDALITAKKEYLTLVASLDKELSGISKDERGVANGYKAKLDRAYVAACREYEIPATGVVSNLNDLIRQLDNMHSKNEFVRFQNVRIGMLRKLDDLYLCVEQNSKSIAEVKRLSQALKNKYESKKQEFGVE